MARAFNAPLQVRAAGTYGPFSIDGKVLGDRGAVVTIARSTDGVWPGAPNEQVVSLNFEFLYGAQWVPAGGTVFYGGTQVDKWTQGTRLAERCTIEWPLIGRDPQTGTPYPQPIPDPPDAVRATVVLAQALNVGASVAWLS